MYIYCTKPDCGNLMKRKLERREEKADMKLLLMDRTLISQALLQLCCALQLTSNVRRLGWPLAFLQSEKQKSTPTSKVVVVAVTGFFDRSVA